jgi:hypothetical protein
MTAAVFDFPFIRAVLERRPYVEPIVCSTCSDVGWQRTPYNPYALAPQVWEQCRACHNPRNLPCP